MSFSQKDIRHKNRKTKILKKKKRSKIQNCVQVSECTNVANSFIYTHVALLASWLLLKMKTRLLPYFWSVVYVKGNRVCLLIASWLWLAFFFFARKDTRCKKPFECLGRVSPSVVMFWSVSSVLFSLTALFPSV